MDDFNFVWKLYSTQTFQIQNHVLKKKYLLIWRLLWFENITSWKDILNKKIMQCNLG